MLKEHKNIINKIFIKQLRKFGFNHPNCVKAKDFFQKLVNLRQHAKLAIAEAGHCEEAAANTLRNYYLAKADEVLTNQYEKKKHNQIHTILQVRLLGTKIIAAMKSSRDHAFVIFTSKKIKSEEIANNFKQFLTTFAKDSEICDAWSGYYGNNSSDWFNDFEKNPDYQNVQWNTIFLADQSIPFHNWANAELFYKLMQVTLELEENSLARTTKETFAKLQLIVIEHEQGLLTKTLEEKPCQDILTL